MPTSNISDEPHADLELEVGVGVPDVELRHLVSVSSTFAALINEVAEQYAGTPKPVRWLVEVKGGSVRLPLRSEPASESVSPAMAHEIPSAIAEGISQLEREPVRPEYFNNRALEQVKALANAGVPLAVRNGNGRFPMSQQAAINVDKVLGKPTASYGTIEGRLEEVSIHDSQAFAIWQVDEIRVRCVFGKYVALEEVLAGVGKRVAARGPIKARPTGEPMSVEVEELRILDPAEVTAADVRGIFRGHEVAGW